MAVKDQPHANGAVVVAGLNTSDEPVNLTVNSVGELLVSQEGNVLVHQSTASELVYTGAGVLHSVVCVASTNGDLTLYDSLTGSGTVLYTHSGNLSVGEIITFGFIGIPFTTGLYATISGSALTVNFSYGV